MSDNTLITLMLLLTVASLLPLAHVARERGHGGTWFAITGVCFVLTAAAVLFNVYLVL